MAVVCYNQLHKLEAGEGDMEKLSILILLIAIFCASFSGKMYMAVRGDKQAEKVIAVCSAGALLICTMAIISILL